MATAVILSLMFPFFVSAGCTCKAAPADPFTVFDTRPVQPGPQITGFLRYQLEAAWRQDELRANRLADIRSETDLFELQRVIRARLLENIGGLPAEKTPLNPRITGTIDMDGYRIEKVVFESLPGYYVTSLLYLPDGDGPMPAVIFTCGHSPVAKAYPGYQQICARLARKGYIVHALDPAGQGERSQFWDSSRAESRYNRVCGEHAILGNLAYLAGASLARWEIWDAVRSHDYLRTRPEVDPERISITGNSGGGTRSALAGAVDRRNIVGLPSCYISSLPMRMANRIFADPDSDPEQDIYRMVSDGIGHAGLVLLRYPDPVVLSVAVEDFFPIEGARKTFREVEAVYRRFGKADRIAMTQGYHEHGFSDHNQEFAFAFLDRFSGMPVRYSLDSVRTLTDRELWCTESGQVLDEYSDARNLTELIRDYARQKARGKSLKLDSLYHAQQYPGVEAWEMTEWDRSFAAKDRIAWQEKGSDRVRGLQVDRYILHHSDYMRIPLLHFIRPGQQGGNRVLLWLGHRGKATRADLDRIGKYVEQGWSVVSFDFRGQGENRMKFTVVSIDDPSLAAVEMEKQYYSPVSGVVANYVYNTLLNGRPLFLQMIEDVEIASIFARRVLGAESLAVTGMEDTHTVAVGAARVVDGLELIAASNGRLVSWKDIVEQQTELWPIELLLPDGAYIDIE